MKNFWSVFLFFIVQSAILSLATLQCPAQDCRYQDQINRGNTALEDQEYFRALALFITSRYCPDKPSNDQADALIDFVINQWNHTRDSLEIALQTEKDSIEIIAQILLESNIAKDSIAKELAKVNESLKRESARTKRGYHAAYISRLSNWSTLELNTGNARDAFAAAYHAYRSVETFNNSVEEEYYSSLPMPQEVLRSFGNAVYARYSRQYSSAHTRELIDLKFHPDGRHFLTIGRDSTLGYWSVTGGLIARFRNPGGYIRSAGFSPYSDWIVLTTNDGWVKVFRTILPIPDANFAQKPFWEKHLGERVIDAVFTTDQHLITITESGLLSRWAIPKPKVVEEIRLEPGRLIDLLVTPDGSGYLLRGARQVYFLTAEGALDPAPLLPATALNPLVLSISIAPEGQRIAVTQANGAVTLFDEAGRPLDSLQLDDGAYTCRFSNRADRLLVGTAAGAVVQLEISGDGFKEAVTQFPGSYRPYLEKVAYVPPGSNAYYAYSPDTSILMADREAIDIFSDDADKVIKLMVNDARGKYLIAFSGNGKGYLLSLTGTKIIDLGLNNRHALTDAYFTPDGQYFILVDRIGQVRISPTPAFQISQMEGCDDDTRLPPSLRQQLDSEFSDLEYVFKCPEQ